MLCRQQPSLRTSLFDAGDVSRGGTSATQRQKFHTDDANQCLHNKSSSHGVPNINLSNFTCLLVYFGKTVVFICQRAPAKLECFFSKRVYSTNIDCFDIDSSGFHLTFVTFYLFSVIRKQQLKRCNCSVDQSALLIGFRTDFTSSVWNLCPGVADVPPRETSPAAKSVEKRMFSQANNNRMPFCSVYFRFIKPE